MKVIEYLKENGFNKLAEEFKVKVSEQDGLYMLNYHQVNSPKHPITDECRSLILDGEFNVISRAFDRFYNLNEQDGNGNLVSITGDWSQYRVYDKVDGSLIKIYYHEGNWHVSSRGQVKATQPIDKMRGVMLTFTELVWKIMGVTTQEQFNAVFNNIPAAFGFKNCTFIMEVCSLWNKVVIEHAVPKLYLLGVRENTEEGKYHNLESFLSLYASYFIHHNITPVPIDRVSTLDDLLSKAEVMSEEGYVIYKDNVPYAKLKSSVYLKLSLIRAEGLTHTSVLNLLVDNEQEEYLAYYSEDRWIFDEYNTALKEIFDSIDGDIMLFKEQLEAEGTDVPFKRAMNMLITDKVQNNSSIPTWYTHLLRETVNTSKTPQQAYAGLRKNIKRDIMKGALGFINFVGKFIKKDGEFILHPENYYMVESLVRTGNMIYRTNTTLEEALYNKEIMDGFLKRMALGDPLCGETFSFKDIMTMLKFFDENHLNITENSIVTIVVAGDDKRDENRLVKLEVQQACILASGKANYSILDKMKHTEYGNAILKGMVEAK